MQKIADDLLQRAKSGGKIYLSDFYPAASWESVRLSGNYILTGGIEPAERKLLIALPAFIDRETFDVSGCIAAVKVLPADRAAYSHRDYLGSLMALQIDRAKVGDIVAADRCGYVLLRKELQDFVLRELTSVSKTSCVCEAASLAEIPKTQQDRVEETVSVSSMRLDCLLTAAFRLSRSKAQELVDGGFVTVKKQPALKSEKLLCAGDDVSARRFGRFEILEILGESRKGKLRVKIGVQK